MRIFRRDGRIHVRTSTQTPFPTKEKLGYLFSRDPDHFHVYTKRVGGGFGGKQEMLGRRALAEIRAPIGINIGADSPAEIAVSVLAEVFMVLRRADGRCGYASRWTMQV